MLHLYWGDGKGKTTAAMGLALRALGHGRRVVILQFLKDGSRGTPDEHPDVTDGFTGQL